MKNRIRLLMIFTFILVGCASQPPVKSTPTSQPVHPRPTVTPISTAAQTSSAPLSHGLLLVRYDEPKNLSFLSVVDPANGYELTGRQPISLGQAHYEKLSPDRKTLAVIVHKIATDPIDGDLLLIDLEDWTTRRIELNLHEWTTDIDYSPDGRLVALANTDKDSTIILLDVQQGKILLEKKVGLPIRQLKFNADGSALMVYGVPGDLSTNLTSGDPQVGLLKVDDLSWQWNTSLTGMRDGVYRYPGKTGDLHAPGNGFFIIPGIAFDPGDDMLYVVNAEKDELTRVDFAAQTVKTQVIHTELSWLDQLLSLTATTVHAKGMDSNEKTILVSPDGQFLYITGAKNEYTMKDDDLQFNQVPLGLQIVRAADAVRTGNFETTAHGMVLSSDGALLYLYRWDEPQGITDVFDTHSSKMIASLKGFSLTPTHQLDGSPVLVSVDMQGNGKVQLAVFNPNSTTPNATWLTPDFPSWLILP